MQKFVLNKPYNLFLQAHFLSQRETLQPLQVATFVHTAGRIPPIAGFYWESWLFMEVKN